MDEIRQTLGHLEPCVVCKVWVWQQRDRTRTKKTDNNAHIHMFTKCVTSLLGFMCFVLMFLWILVFHVVTDVGRLIVQRNGFSRQLHSTTQTQYLVQSYALLDVVVRLFVLSSSTQTVSQFLAYLTTRKGVFWGLLFTPPVGYNRPLSAVNDPPVTKLNYWKPSSEVFATGRPVWS